MCKTTLLLFTIIALIACKTKTINKEPSIVSKNCPKDGKCLFEVLENKRLHILTDEFGNSYFELQESKENIVLRFEYQRNQNPQFEVDAYSEVVFVQIDTSTTHLELGNKTLENAKVSFSRMCFCKGVTGIYTVKKGKLQLKKTDKEFLLKLDFQIDEVPHVITSIDVNISI